MLTDAKKMLTAEQVVEHHRTMGFVDADLRRVAGSSFPKSTAGPFSPDQREYVWHMDRGRCLPCGKTLPLNETECDHIRRKADGGQNVLENARTLCRACHAEKSAAEVTLQNLAKRAGGDLVLFLNEIMRTRGDGQVKIVDVMELINVYTPYSVDITLAIRNVRNDWKQNPIRITRDDLDITIHLSFPLSEVDKPGGRTRKNVYGGVALTKEGREMFEYAQEHVHYKDVYAGGCPAADRVLSGMHWRREGEAQISVDLSRYGTVH